MEGSEWGKAEVGQVKAKTDLTQNDALVLLTHVLLDGPWPLGSPFVPKFKGHRILTIFTQSLRMPYFYTR